VEDLLLGVKRRDDEKKKKVRVGREGVGGGGMAAGSR
jgi:hypothetical protein